MDDVASRSAADTLRTRIRELMEKMGSDPTRLAKQIGRSKDFVRDFLDGRKDSINPFSLAEIERVAEIDPGTLTLLLPVEPGEDLQNLHTERRLGAHVMSVGASKCPLKSSREIFGTPYISVSRSSIGRIERPGFCERDQRAYAIILEGERMVPAYEAGDTVFLAPTLGLRRNTDVIVFRYGTQDQYTDRKKDEEDWVACVGRLADINERTITLRQYKPASEFELDRAEWSGAVRIVAKFSK